MKDSGVRQESSELKGGKLKAQRREAQSSKEGSSKLKAQS